MFDGVREFFAMLDVHPFWPTLLVTLSFVQCLFPYKPVAKIKETKDKDGNKLYVVYKHRDK